MQTPWWKAQQKTLLAKAKQSTPMYVYHAQTLQEQIEKLYQLSTISRFFYSMKANDYDGILRFFEKTQIGFQCVSEGELKAMIQLFPHISADRLLFTPNFCHRSEYQLALTRCCTITLDNIYPLQQWPEDFVGKEIMLRFDPAEGQGHHPHVKTAGKQSKFGIDVSQISEVIRLTQAHQMKVIGLHAHLGSGIMDPLVWAKTAEFLSEMAQSFNTVRTLNLGGGLGVPSHFNEPELNLSILNKGLIDFKSKHPDVKLWLEPGRFLVAPAGVLLTRVTQLKEKAGIHYVGVDAGMNTILRPALYDAYHEIINLSQLEKPANFKAHMVGPICESGDVLGYDRMIAQPKEGDVLLIANAGAYGAVMASNYNLRGLPKSEMLFTSG